MKNELMIFKNEEFGQVRTLLNKEGEIYFVGKDVAQILGYSKLDSMYRRLTDKQKLKINPQSLENTGFPQNLVSQLEPNPNVRTMVIITEGGLYKAIMGSTLKKAEGFQDWVTDEVLPTLRKTGLYSLIENNPSSELQIVGKNIITQVKELMMDTVKNFNNELDKRIDILDTKVEVLEDYYKPTHKKKLGYNTFIRSCLGDNATKENCEKAKTQFLFLLGDYETYQEVPKDILETHNSKALAYDICKNINNSIKAVD